MIKVVSKHCVQQSSNVGFGVLGRTVQEASLFGKLHTILQLLASMRALHLSCGFSPAMYYIL